MFPNIFYIENVFCAAFGQIIHEDSGRMVSEHTADSSGYAESLFTLDTKLAVYLFDQVPLCKDVIE